MLSVDSTIDREIIPGFAVVVAASGMTAKVVITPTDSDATNGEEEEGEDGAAAAAEESRCETHVMFVILTVTIKSPVTNSIDLLETWYFSQSLFFR